MANILPSPPLFGLTSGRLIVATGAASVGNSSFTASGNTLDLAAAGTMSIGGTATQINLNGVTYFRTTGLANVALFDTGSAQFYPVTDSTGTLGASTKAWSGAFAYTFRGNALDTLTATQLTIGGTNATTVVFGNATSTNTINYVTNGLSTGHNFTGINAYFHREISASAGTPLLSSMGVNIRSNYWNGTASTPYDAMLQMIPDSTAPTGHLGLYIAASEQFRFTSTGNFNIVAGGGIDTITAGTLNFATINTNTLNIGNSSTPYPVTISGSTLNIGLSSFLDVQFALGQHAFFETSTLATSGTQLINSPGLTLRGRHWNGTASVSDDNRILTVVDSTTPTSHFAFQFNGTERFQLTSAGAANIVANGSIGNIAQAATNTTAMTIAPNVVNGSGSIGLVVNAVTGLFRNASAKILTIQNAGTEILALQEDSTFNSVFVSTRSLYSFVVQAAVSNQFYSSAADGASAVSCIVDTNNSWSNATAKLISARTNGSEKFYVTAAGNVVATGNITANGGLGFIANNGLDTATGVTLPIGTATASAVSIGNFSGSGAPIFVNSNFVYGGAQSVAAATSVTIQSALSVVHRISLSATAITSLTVNTGNDGQRLIVEVIQDGTGSRTIPTTWTNVAFAGGSYTRTTTANKRDVLTFLYNSGLGKWVEVSRAMNI